ncbi:MAG TPA: DinB family protein, partial [Thermomicrobiales bacterium]|nr:DinB family protein [Thermomicrobiales bacterium]
MPEGSRERRTLVIDLDPTFPPEIARWLWVLGDTRHRTLETLDGVDESTLDVPGPGGNSIGTILAHIAVIEVDWMCAEILEQPYPDDLVALLPPSARDPDGQLTATPATPLGRYVTALDAVRERLLDTVRALDLTDLRRPRSLPDYDVSPDWVL